MTEPNKQAPTDDQNEQALNFLRNEIADLKSRLTKKEDRIATLDVMLNQIMESHHAEVRALLFSYTEERPAGADPPFRRLF